jgi:mRNA deadenylase 3'-5' endonuclease subunit Ccr4
MSYNVLADAYAQEHARELYSAVPWAALEWGARAGLIAREVAHWSPDVVCLQEVDHYPHLERLLKPHGYKGTFTPRTGGRPDGLAMFWKRSRFRAEALRPLEFASMGLKDNVAQVALLRGKESGKGGGADGEAPALLVANIHVLFNPKRGDIKLGQVRTLLEEVAAAQRGRPAPAVVCGDFNSAVGSPLYEFVLEGELELGPVDRRRLSGQVEVAGRSGWPAIRAAFLNALAAGAVSEADAMEVAVSGSSMDCSEDSGAAAEGQGMRRGGSAVSTAGVSNHSSWSSSSKRSSAAAKGPRPWSSEDLTLAAGSAETGVARHPLCLRSAYHSVTGSEPLYTTVHDRYVGTVDYIFYGDGEEAGLKPVRVLKPPSLSSVPSGLPSLTWPSDHLSLVADFELV